MAWRFCQQPNGLYARFSEVVDDFTDFDLTREKALAYCATLGMSPVDAEYKVLRADNSPRRWQEAQAIIARKAGDKHEADYGEP